MGNPVNTDEYPPFEGTTGKQDMLRAGWAAKGSMGSMQQFFFRVANTPFSGCTDLDVIYTPDGVFESA